MDCTHALTCSFDFIVTTETWMHQTSSVPDNSIPGCNRFNGFRSNKKDGGVALYIKGIYESKLITHKTAILEGILRCVTVEINFTKQSPKIISSIYRAPGQRLLSFYENIEQILNNDCTNKTQLVCGDFNIDSLQHETQDCVKQFLHLMYTIGLYPLITNKTRITHNTPILINNIFTTNVEQHYTCGLLINDKSDHLPIFAVRKYTNKNETKTKHNTKWVR